MYERVRRTDHDIRARGGPILPVVPARSDRSGFSRVWDQLWSDRSLVTSAQYCVYDAFIGLILLAVAMVILVEPRVATAGHAAVCGAIGLILLVGPWLAKRRPAMLPRLLALDGALLTGLGLWLAGDSVVWALRAPAHSPFRYAPGMFLLPVAYGALQLIDPDDASTAAIQRRRLLRRLGLLVGVVGELTVAAALLARAARG